MQSSFNSTNPPWQYDPDTQDEDDINQSLARLEKQQLDQQQQHLNRLRLLKERENCSTTEQPHYQRSRTMSRTEDSNYTRATSSSRSRAAATAAEKAGSISTARKRVSSRDARHPSLANPKSDYDTGSENGEPLSPTYSKHSTRHKRPSAAAQFTEKDRDLLLRSSSLQTRRVSDAQLTAPRMHHRQTSTGLLNKRKSSVAEPFYDSALPINDIPSERKYSTLSSADTNGISRNRLSKLFDDMDSTASSKYTLPRKSSLRASRNFSTNPQRLSNNGSLRSSPPTKSETEDHVGHEYLEHDSAKQRAVSRNKDGANSKVYDSDVSDSKEARIVRKSSTSKLRPKSRALKSPPPPLNFEGPPNVPSLSQKYAMYSPKSAHPAVSERTSSLHPEMAQQNADVSTTNKVKRHQSLGANVHNRPPRTSSHRHMQGPLDSDSTLNDANKANEQPPSISRKSLPASFRSRSRAISTSEKSLEALVGELDITSNPESSHSSKKENRKSSGSLRRTPSRISISEYQGYTRSTSTHTHRTSISSSPPPSRSSTAFGDNDESKNNALEGDKEDIPPVPPVPKHHSFFNKGIDALKISHSRDNSIGTSKDSHSDDGSDHNQRLNHHDITNTEGHHSPDINRLLYRGSNGIRRKLSASAESNPDTTSYDNPNWDTENAHTGTSVVTRPPVDRRKYLDEEDSETKKITTSVTAIENKPPAKAIVSRKRGKTLPGNLAAPPPVPSLPLPPMKLEPMKLDLRGTSGRKELPRSPSSATNATTPTRIPVPVFRYGVSKAANSDIDLSVGGQITSSEDESGPLGLMLPTKAERRLSSRRLSYSKGSRTAPSSPRLSQFALSTTKSTSHPNLHDTDGNDDDHPLSVRSPSMLPTPASSTNFDHDKHLASASSQTSDNAQRRISRSGANTIGGQVGARYTSRRHSVASISSLDTHAPETAKKPSHHGAMDESILRRRHERNRRLSLHERLQNLVAEHRIKEDDEDVDNKWDPKLALEINKQDTRERYAGPRTVKKSTVRPHTVYEEYNSRQYSTTEERDQSPPKVYGFEGMKPRHALEAYSSQLCPYEREEVPKYGKVYYISPKDKKHYATPEKAEFNHGYDDERGDYNIMMHDHLCYRYEITELLGKGSFGQVLKCLDHKTGESVAIKIIRNKKRFHAQALVEVKILQDLVSWDPEDRYNNVRMTDHFYFRNHLCIAFECLSMNLYEFIKSNNFRGFSLALIKRFTVQILNSLSLLHRHNVIHCDLKPENILLKYPNRSTIKIIDFGSSCLQSEKVYTYIQSRFYRSPEVILGMTYSMTIDMWSLGCILAELYTGYPLFPGENEQEQLACIMEVQGVPEPYLVEKSTRRKLFFDSYGNPRIVPNSRGKKRKPNSKSLAQVLRCSDQLFVEFVSRCLDWDPEKRMTPDEGMFHEWILESSHKSVPNRQSVGTRYSEGGTLTPPSSAAKLYSQSKSLSKEEKILTAAQQLASIYLATN
ncbi:serine/threonine protein kinase [Umbelopsis nana]